MILRDKKDKMWLFGVNPSHKEEDQVSGSMFVARAHVSQITELFDLFDNSWGYYRIPDTIANEFNKKGQHFSFSKLKINTN
jgi:hypothetical protein